MSQPSSDHHKSIVHPTIFPDVHNQGSSHSLWCGREHYMTDGSVLTKLQWQRQKPGEDYCLISHEAPEEMLPHIHAQGLKSLAQLASEPGCSKELLDKYMLHENTGGFWPLEKDAHVLYFHPTVYTTEAPSLHLRKIRSNSVVFAVPTKEVFIHNSRLRKFEGNYGLTLKEWSRSSKNYNSFMNTLLSLEPGQQMNRYGSGPAEAGEEPYLPEVVIAAHWINPKCRVKLSEIPLAMRETSNTEAGESQVVVVQSKAEDGGDSTSSAQV